MTGNVTVTMKPSLANPGKSDRLPASLYFSQAMEPDRSQPSADSRSPRRHAGKAKWLILLALALSVSLPAMGQGHSGIPEIDSLPLHDWRKPGPPLSYGKALTFSLIPGGGQFYGRHPVRGGFLLGMESILVGLAAYSYFVDIPRLEDESEDALDAADSLYLESLANPDEATGLEIQRANQVLLARERNDLAARQTDLVRSQVAWAAGLHFYGIMDAVEIAYLSRHPDGIDRSVRTAMYRGLFFPGGGQMYNRRYGKFGMLWMALGASAVSAYSRQGMVEDLNDQLSVARAEAQGTAAASQEVEDLEEDRTLYRKRRNQYIWGMAVLYVYAVMDGMVDAALSDFDAPEKFAFSVEPSGAMALALKLRF